MNISFDVQTFDNDNSTYILSYFGHEKTEAGIIHRHRREIYYSADSVAYRIEKVLREQPELEAEMIKQHQDEKRRYAELVPQLFAQQASGAAAGVRGFNQASPVVHTDAPTSVDPSVIS